MSNFEKINSKFQLDIDINPNNADWAIIPIGEYNEYESIKKLVLSDYGYHAGLQIAPAEINRGYYLLQNKNRKKSVLFINTIPQKNREATLLKNLYNALLKYIDLYSGKKIWFPLIDNGINDLSLKELYNLVAITINQLETDPNTTFLLSLPHSKLGIDFRDEFQLARSTENSDLENLLSQLNYNFYLADSSWGLGLANDHTDRFIRNAIWERRMKDDYYSSDLNKVKVNDILILKSRYQIDNDSYLTIKAIGVVTNNPLNGTLLEIDWKISGLDKKIHRISHYYKEAFQLADIRDIILIFSELNYKELLPLLFENKTLTPTATETKQEVNSIKIANFLSDSEIGADHLNISKDVSAFARVIAAKSFIPPLAIALLGEWGSGKSFFMRMLKEEISQLSNNASNQVYCKGIAQIHFNAWSYTDANLWASIVSKIFEGLNHYINNNTPAGEIRKEVESQLSNSLNIIKEEVVTLQSSKVTLENQIKVLKRRKADAEKELEDKTQKIRKNTLWEIIKKINETFNFKEKILDECKNNKSLVETTERLQQIIPDEYWSNPKAAYDIIKSRYVFLKFFSQKDKIWKNLVWLSAILLGIYFIPELIFFLCHIAKNSVFSIPQNLASIIITIGFIWRNIENVYEQLGPVISTFWKVKKEYEDTIQQATEKFQQEEKALSLEIKNKEIEILSIDKQLQKAETEKKDIEFKINNAISTESLYSFIDRRSKTEDYKKHLGIISIIRKDFEILNELFAGHDNELSNVKDIQSFRKKFNKPLQRIVLYIDDLDRCAEGNVVQVLEAVNLLMAFPLFVVVVGVDARWVKNALTQKHKLQFGNKSGIEMLEPSNYLEKIFQIPFQLKGATESDVKQMIRKLSNIETSTSNQIKSSLNPNLEEQMSESDIVNEYYETLNQDIEDWYNSPTLESTDPTELLSLTETEVNAMEQISVIIGNNPRAIKRFVNIFQIVKAHGDLLKVENDHELYVILFMLALPLGIYRKLAPSLEEFLFKNPQNLLNDYFDQQNHNHKNLDNLKNRLKDLLSNNAELNIVQNSQGKLFLKHISFIKRFTFERM